MVKGRNSYKQGSKSIGRRERMTKILISEGGTIVFFEEGKPISQMIGEIIITCKICGQKELVVKRSFCCKTKLCVTHARERLNEHRR